MPPWHCPCSLLTCLFALLLSSHVASAFSFLHMSLSSPPLQGKVALVTGASRGIGRGIALELASAGATVYATARSLGDKELTEGKTKTQAREWSDRRCIIFPASHPASFPASTQTCIHPSLNSSLPSSTHSHSWWHPCLARRRG